MHQLKRVAAVTGGVVVIGFLALDAALSRIGTIGALLKPFPKVQSFVGSPEGTLFLILIATGAIWWAVRNPNASTPDVGSLHEANTRLTNEVASLRARTDVRHLTPVTSGAIARALASGLERYWQQRRGELERERFKVTLVSIGRERETLDYRADFEKAFVAGGFDVATNEWEAGPPQLEPFTGTLTLLPVFNPKWSSAKLPNAEMRAIVAAALESAGLEIRTAPLPPSPRYDSEGRIVTEGVVSASFSTHFIHNAVHLVIGQRCG